MLTYENEPTIRFALIRRLDKEPGVKICDLQVVPHLHDDPPFIAVGVLAQLGSLLITKSVFHLPAQFEHAHLLNEIDEIAEQYKAARLDFFGRGAVMREPERQLRGNGHRGLWERYG